MLYKSWEFWRHVEGYHATKYDIISWRVFNPYENNLRIIAKNKKNRIILGGFNEADLYYPDKWASKIRFIRNLHTKLVIAHMSRGEKVIWVGSNNLECSSLENFMVRIKGTQEKATLIRLFNAFWRKANNLKLTPGGCKMIFSEDSRSCHKRLVGTLTKTENREIVCKK